MLASDPPHFVHHLPRRRETALVPHFAPELPVEGRLLFAALRQPRHDDSLPAMTLCRMIGLPLLAT